MRGVPESERESLGELFSGYPHLRAVIEGVLDGFLGAAWVDGAAARLDLGVYRIFGGRPADGVELLRQVAPPCELVFPPDDPDWSAQRDRVWGDRARPREMTVFLPREVGRDRLEQCLSRTPSGYRLHPLDARRVGDLDADLAPNRPDNFGSTGGFLERGFGSVAVGAENDIHCAASTYSRSRHHAEIAIATRPLFRRRGLAVPTAAHTLGRCLELGLEAHWSAANEASCRIATALGFVAVGRCRVFDLAGGAS